MAVASLALSSAAPSRFAQELEDPLSHLPCSAIVQYRKGEVIYGQDQPPTRLYLVLEGIVKISRVGLAGRTLAVVSMNRQDEFFGELAFLKLPFAYEEAAALENSKVMSWPISEIEELVIQRPRLGIALLQVTAQRTVELGQRIESFANDSIVRRLARTLIGLSERFAVTEEQDDGSVRIPPFTHQLLSECVGTSREIVTHHLNQLRRQGYLRYSRQAMIIYRDALRNWLDRRGVLEEYRDARQDTPEHSAAFRAATAGNW